MATTSRTATRGLAYDDHGEGDPPLVFLTGWCSSRARWAAVAARCAERRRTVSLDWRGHGESAAANADFGLEELVDDALAVIDSCGFASFIPCSASHAGWVAIELRRRAPERVPAIVHLDWMVASPSSPYMALLERLQTADGWHAARADLFEIWRGGVALETIEEAIAVMEAQGAEMWMRSGRVIASSYQRYGMPIAAHAALEEPAAVLHLYGQPRAAEYLEWQRAARAEHPWFAVEQLDVGSHFSMLEAPAAVAIAIERFVAAATAPRR
jgi:pimeloyl-ACP methyl ester carboxylesterase